ncbi:TonB-dependent receptor [Pseudoalteromonas luteoviolacea]|uniref:Ligand-gated channel protein n=1 Tax=Pseudoalteromonas luteoviolacea S4054 TaxID=1129367 RepID=A0A0F6A7J0_9GAMM|nr:TonB-dependent receptor [Pseudoalteromonas luteoviolacea]AOT07614.1 ligand-gated channel protein [Pseudoalteromonas luteoviolacea]AOT12530.1 ligand-gated channel protein [Pseudoalteromonas luteoviolacea]AOT17444.1 ligand-gated channel protein [Pseudoalteromonas luteoviolacea]KKE81354.1 ligand-gated channel protein [Pseudoalteromonas luteoviolacea S4054]KZN70637.1 ligand-gated channel protein [Pseudoalteromonas luteoviolacea S4047-1]
MSTFKPSMLTLALVTAGLSNQAIAEQSEESVKNDQKKVEVVEVRGFRASIVKSINTKRFSSEVVESISAEDIGKLPDSSIAESIARLPGITSQRLDGRSNRVTVRGFSENEGATTLNGREQVSINDNRGVEFDLYPSEIMSGVTVYKTPSAKLDAEGVAGVIDMQTVRPLSVSDRVVQVNALYEKSDLGKLNPDADNTGMRGTFSYIDKFNDDTMGVALALTTTSSPSQEQRWNSWGYPEFEENGKQYSILGGAKPFVRSTTLERDSVMFVFEAAPNDKLSMVFDALYIDFSEDKILRGIEIPFAWGQGLLDPQSVSIDEASGFITSAITEGQRAVVRNDYDSKDAQMQAFGFNATYELTDATTIEVDLSHSSVENKIWSLESYSGTGRGDLRGAADNIGYTFNTGNTGAQFTHELDYSDYDLIKVGGPLSWGGSSALNEKYGTNADDHPFKNTLQDGFINAPVIEDEINALRLAAQHALDNDYISSVEAGISYKDRDKSRVSEGYFMTLKDFSYPDNTGLLTVPEQYRLGTANLDFIGMGDMIAYDSRAMVADGYFSLLAESLTDASHAARTWSVNEEVTAAFVQANIDMEVAGMPLKGNTGLRYVKTEVETKGSKAGVDAQGQVILEDSNEHHDYSHLLPSLNLSLSIDDEQMLRFGYAKTISRARMSDMNSSVIRAYKDVPDENGNYWEITGGNPELEPKEADGFDLTYENYYHSEGYFTVGAFYKDIKTWIFDSSTEEDLSGVVNPKTGEVPANSTATRKLKVNGGGGDLYGYEFAVTFPLTIIHSSMEGFGLIASHTRIFQDVEDHNGQVFELAGLSKKMSNLTFYYENHGFQFRASMRKRSDFKGDVYGTGFKTEQVDILGETIWDAQLGYDFGEAGIKSLEGLTVTLQAQNITEEPFTSLSGDNHLQIRDYQEYGRVFLLGASYKF